MKMTNPIPTGYKLSPLGLIPQDWEDLKLGKIAKFYKGKGVAKGDLQDQGKFAVIHYGELFREYGAIIHETNYYIASNKDTFLSEKGDVLMPTSDVTPTGIATASTVIKSGIVLGGDILVIRLDLNKVNNIYFTYFARLHRNQIIRLVTGTTVYHIYGQDMKNFHIIFPKSLPEQKAIASILSTCDETITQTQQLIDKLELRHKALCQQLLTGKKRVAGFSGERKEVRLGEVTKKVSRRNSKLVDAVVYSVTNKNGFVPQTEHFSKEIAGSDLSNYKIIKKGEFAYNPARINVGSIGYFSNELGVISSLYVMFDTTNELRDRFLYWLLDLQKTKHDICRYGEGGVRIYLWYELFSMIKIKLPNIEEQNSIIQIIDDSQNQINQAKTKLNKLQELKKGLMQQLLTGKKRVNLSLFE